MKKNYQLFLVLYLALGVAISGYFYLYPYYHRLEKYTDFGQFYVKYEEGNEFGVSVLTTIVGVILIGGIGIIFNNPEQK